MTGLGNCEISNESEGYSKNSERLPVIIKDTENLFNETFKLNMALNYKLLVGTFGSNAFVTRDNKLATITFRCSTSVDNFSTAK